MSFGRKKSSSVEPQQVSFSPRSYENIPFGKYEYKNGGFVTTPSESEGKAISLRQQMIQELLPELNTTSDARAGQISNYSDLFTNKILEKSLPMFTGDQYARGLAGSTSYNRGYMDIINDAIQRGLFAGEDLYKSDEASKLSTGQFLESGLQNAFNRLMGITQEGRAGNDQYFNIQNQNANRVQAADQFNGQVNLAQDQAKLGAVGDLAGLGGLLAFSRNQNPTLANGSSSAESTLNKTGSAGDSFKAAAKNPNTYLQLAQLAAMLGAMCWVAAEVFGDWHHPKAVGARVYMNLLAPVKLRKNYAKFGERIAFEIRKNPGMKKIFRPLFEDFAERGQALMEANYAFN